MNKRIKELVGQAGGYVSLSYEHDGQLILSGEDIVQKFTELLVQECAGIVETESDRGTKHTIDQILKHFGVEE